MRLIHFTTSLLIGTMCLVATAQDNRETQTAPRPGADADADQRIVGTVTIGGEGGGSGGDNFVVFARDAQTPTKTTYLGVSTSTTPPALAKQLQLKAGVGLVVDACESGSPAEKAGVKEFDVLHKLDDQILVNTEQLAVLVRSMEAGKDCKLTVIREGTPQVLPVKLGQRDVPPMRLTFHDAHHPFLVDAAPQLKLNMGVEPQFRRGMLRLHTPDGKEELTATRITIENAKHKMTLSSPEGRKHLHIEDKEGKILFDGPISTKEEIEKIPGDLRKLYQEVLKDYSVEIKPEPTPVPPTPTAPAEPKQR